MKFELCDKKLTYTFREFYGRILRCNGGLKRIFIWK